MILLDTSVLSHAFRRRRRPPHPALDPTAELERMVAEDWTLAVPGVVLQELLSGVRTVSEFERLRTSLEGFPVITATVGDHLAAARIANSCRAAGIAASTIDCLIAAQAIAAEFFLFTLDQDFRRIASCCGLALWPPPESRS